MKSFLLLSIICLMFTNASYAQSWTKTQDAILERKILEAVAKDKKQKEEAMKKEREEARNTEERHRHQKNEYEEKYNSQMKNLNQVSAEDFMAPPQQQREFSTGVNKFRDTQQTPVVYPTPKEEKTNRPIGNPFGNSDRIGTPTYSGNNYTGDRYGFKRSGFDNTQQQRQTSVPASHIRKQYKPERIMRQPVVNIQKANTTPRVYVQSPQQQIIARNVRNGQGQRQVVGQKKSAKGRVPQTEPIQKKEVAWSENGKIHVDTPKPVRVIQSTSSSTDLKPVDKKSVTDATKAPKPKVYPLTLTNQADYLSDRDNKKTPNEIAKETMKKRGISGRTVYEQDKLMRKDAANGFSSIFNPQEWEYIYGVNDAGALNTSRVVIKRR